MTRQKRLLIGLSTADVMALHDAWLRFEEAEADRAAALVSHLCSELGVLEARHLTLVPDQR